MGKISVKLLVDGGKASAGPPLGPSLAPHKVNVGQVVAKINEKTKEFAGITVPVEVVVDTSDKSFDIVVGLPPTSQLIKKELKSEKLAITPWTLPKPKEEGQKTEMFKGSITMEQAVKVAKIKADSLVTKDKRKALKQVLGTCISCGVSVEGKNPKELFSDIDSGKWDTILKHGE